MSEPVGPRKPGDPVKPPVVVPTPVEPSTEVVVPNAMSPQQMAINAATTEQLQGFDTEIKSLKARLDKAGL